LPAEDVIKCIMDGQWHDICDIENTLDKPTDVVAKVLNFYEKFGFVEFDEARRKVIIPMKIREIFL
jgi:hypothetical protein